MPSLLLFITIMYSCSFPNKSLNNKIDNFSRELSFYRTELKKQYPSTLRGEPTCKIKDSILRRRLGEDGIDNITIQYKFKNYGLDKQVNSYLSSHDSTISFSWVNKHEDYDIVTSLIYSFSKVRKENIKPSQDCLRFKRINDSIWLERYRNEIIWIE